MLAHSQNSQWGWSMEGEKEGSVSEVKEALKTDKHGADKVIMNMVRTSEFILRAWGNHWRVSIKRQKEKI